MTETIDDVCAAEPEAVAWTIDHFSELAMQARTQVQMLADGQIEMTEWTVVDASLLTSLALIARGALTCRSADLRAARAALGEFVRGLGETAPDRVLDLRNSLLDAPGDQPTARVYRALGIEVESAITAALYLALE